MGCFSLIFHIIGVAYFYIVSIRITFPNAQPVEASEATALLSALQSGCLGQRSDLRQFSDACRQLWFHCLIKIVL
jgi:hypothetical protein